MLCALLLATVLSVTSAVHEPDGSLVFLIPHSNCGPSSNETFDDSFVTVKAVLDNVTDYLSAHSDKRFVWSDVYCQFSTTFDPLGLR